MTELSQKDQRRNLILNCLHEGSWGFGIAFNNSYAVIPLFLSLLGAPEGVVISVAGLFSILIAIPQFASALMGRNIRNIRTAVLGVHTLVWPAIFIAGFTFAFFAPTGPTAWIFYYICFILYGLSIGVVIPIWADFLNHATNEGSRGNFFGISFAFNSIGGFIGGIVVKWLLDNHSFPESFGWGFLITFASLVVGTAVFIFYKIKEPQEIQPHKTIRQFISDTREMIGAHRNFKRYILSRIFFTANFPAVSLYAINAHDRFGFEISEAGVFTAINTISFGLASYLAGRVGDRFGHKTSIIMSMTFHLTALTIAIFAQNMWWVYAVFFFLGAGIGSFMPASLSLVYAFARDRDKKTYIALTETSVAPFTFIAIMVAGSLIHMTDVVNILYGVGIMILISMALMIFTVRDPKNANGV